MTTKFYGRINNENENRRNNRMKRILKMILSSRKFSGTGYELVDIMIGRQFKVDSIGDLNRFQITGVMDKFFKLCINEGENIQDYIKQDYFEGLDNFEKELGVRNEC